MLASDLIAATRRHLHGTQRTGRNKLDGALDGTSDTVTLLNDLGGVKEGAVISCGLEDMYVWSVAGQDATVERGYNSSVQSAHDDGAIVEVNPRFTAFELLTHANTDLTDLSSPANGLFRIGTLDITSVSGQVGYDFPVTGFLSIADARWKDLGDVSKDWTPLGAVVVEPGMPTDVFASGTALFVEGMPAQPGQTIRIRYKATFNPLTSLEDDVAAVTGLPETAEDLPALGAALIAMAGRPIARGQYSAQGDTRRAQEVSVSDVLNAPAALRQLRNNRIMAEAARLAQTWQDVDTERIVIGARR